MVGPDARDFLHRLSTLDVKSLKVGEGAPGCFLTPQGKLRASFQLWRDAAESYFFEFDAGQNQDWKNQLLAFLDQYTFGEKMTVVDQSGDLECLWLFPSREEDARTTWIESGSKVYAQTDSEFGRPWLTLWGPKNLVLETLKEKFPAASELSIEEVDRWRIQQMRPRVGFELTEGASPLEVGLRKFIADQKGCYPGQEVIEKVLSIGSPARRLVRIEAEGSAPQKGDRVLGQDLKTELGTITSVALESGSSVPSRFQILALVKKTFAKVDESVRFSSSQETTGAIMQIAPYE